MRRLTNILSRVCEKRALCITKKSVLHLSKYKYKYDIRSTRRRYIFLVYISLIDIYLYKQGHWNLKKEMKSAENLVLRNFWQIEFRIDIFFY